METGESSGRTARTILPSDLPVNSRVTRRLNPGKPQHPVRRGSKAIQLLKWWDIPRRGWIIILGELVVIISLASGIYSEYVNNAYFQSYVNSLSPILVPIVSIGFGLASATIATLLYFTLRNTKQTEGPRDESLARRRVPPKKVIRKIQVASPRSEQPSEEPGARSRSKLQPVGSYLPKRTPGQSGRDQDDDSE